MIDPRHEFAVFQEAGGKILPAYGPPVRLDLREVFSFGGCEGVFGGRASCARVIMDDGSTYALDVPEESKRHLLTTLRSGSSRATMAGWSAERELDQAV